MEHSLPIMRQGVRDHPPGVSPGESAPSALSSQAPFHRAIHNNAGALGVLTALFLGSFTMSAVPYFTVGQIAVRLAQPIHRIEYLLRSRVIPESGRVGGARVFDEAGVERIASELRRMGRKIGGAA